MSDLHPNKIAQGKYLHTKSSKHYEVIGVALHSETLEQMVVYKPLYKSDVEYFVRPYKMFTEQTMIDGVVLPRFQKID